MNQRQKTIRDIGKTYHFFKPNNNRDIQNLCQDKASMDMLLQGLKIFLALSWKQKISTTKY